MALFPDWINLNSLLPRMLCNYQVFCLRSSRCYRREYVKKKMSMISYCIIVISPRKMLLFILMKLNFLNSRIYVSLVQLDQWFWKVKNVKRYIKTHIKRPRGMKDWNLIIRTAHWTNFKFRYAFHLQHDFNENRKTIIIPLKAASRPLVSYP